MNKILIHDYAGHPFQFELSRYLAKRFIVYHLYFENDYGPKADFLKHKMKNLFVRGIGKNINYNKNNFINRFFNDIKYGKELEKQINNLNPDLIISGNCPTLSQYYILKSAKKNKSKFVMWIQDFYSIAVEKLLKKKSFFLTPVSILFKYLEKKQLKDSDKIIIISKDFEKTLKYWNIDLEKVCFIPNWGNLENIIYSKEKNFNFINQNNLDKKKFYLFYTGTLAAKHNPDLILKTAEENDKIEVVVIGVGSGYEKLKKSTNLPKNIHLFPIQPFEKLSDVLNSADAFIAILNEDASVFSVPSKILNYLCAGRPILLSAPNDNLASQIVSNSNSGKVFKAHDFNGINNYLEKLINDSNYRNTISQNARNYAENNFDINVIGKKFLEFLDLK